jgi:hypothetical protein
LQRFKWGWRTERSGSQDAWSSDRVLGGTEHRAQWEMQGRPHSGSSLIQAPPLCRSPTLPCGRAWPCFKPKRRELRKKDQRSEDKGQAGLYISGWRKGRGTRDSDHR